MAKTKEKGGMNLKVKETLDQLVQRITSEEELPGTLAKSLMVIDEDIPCRHWSLRNRLITAMHDHFDARTFNAWYQAGRYVKKGERAFYILRPQTRSHVEKDDATGEEKEITDSVWYIPSPRFGYFQTDGEKDLPYIKKLDSIKIESMPLVDVAKKLKVKVIKSFTTQGQYGSARPDQITMCTTSEQTFLHELSHVIDMKLKNYEKTDYNMGEIVAELSACFLASLYAKKANLLYTRKYIQAYSEKRHVGLVLIKALERVEAIYEFVAKNHRHVEPSFKPDTNGEPKKTRSGEAEKSKEADPKQSAEVKPEEEVKDVQEDIDF